MGNLKTLFILAVLFVGIAFPADTPKDRACIAVERQVLALQAANAQLQFENAQLKLKQLADEEEKIKTAK
jgi:hypothetical protein